MTAAWLLVPVALLLLGIAAVRDARRRHLDRLRSQWGRPPTRTRRLDAIAASHAARVAGRPGRSLDDRTWTDLNLDDVFVAVDRCESTLGQHALYHRLRTAPAGDHLGAFDALTARWPRTRPPANARNWPSHGC